MIETQYIYDVVNKLLEHPDCRSEETTSYMYNTIHVINDIIGMNLQIMKIALDKNGNVIPLGSNEPDILKNSYRENVILPKTNSHIWILQRENYWRIGYESGKSHIFNKDTYYKHSPIPDNLIDVCRCFGDVEQIKKDITLLLLLV